MLAILGWLVLAASILLVISSIIWIRGQVRQADGPTYGTLFSALFFATAVVVVIASKRSPLHLLWLYPLSFVLGSVGMFLPGLNLMVIPLARLYGSMVSVGLDPVEIESNMALRAYLQARYLDLSGKTDDEKKETLHLELADHRAEIIRRVKELRQAGLDWEEAAQRIVQEAEITRVQ